MHHRPYTTRPAPAIDPLFLYTHIRSFSKNTAILESLGQYDKDISRYTIIGITPREIVKGTGTSCIRENLLTGQRTPVDWLTVLDEWTAYDRNAYIDSPVQLGAIGYIGYEEKHRFEKLHHTLENDHNVPSVYLVSYSLLYIYDHLESRAYWVYDENIPMHLITRLENLTDETALPAGPKERFIVHGAIKKDFTREDYLDKIRRTIDYIRNGDIFQANITMRYHGTYTGDPFQVYLTLRHTSPNPFFSWFDFEYPLISTSPERFIQIKNNRIACNPIKGTIKCTINNEDQLQTLMQSEKDHAENTMIVDLIRNDLGRVCKQGTITVDALCAPKKFNTIYHLESIVSGELKPGVKLSHIMQATFPGGSITGAPKIRAMDIIEELEQTQRGPYTGITGFFGCNGWIDSSIAIRIIYFDKDTFYLHAGGGIVVDSKPESEYEELLAKIEPIKYCLASFIFKKK